MAFRVRWNPTSRTCTNCGGSGRYQNSYNTAETECHSCDGKGTIYNADAARKQDKARKALLAMLKKGGMEPVGADGDFELWERKALVERPAIRTRRNRTAPVLSPPVFSFSEAAGLAGMVAALSNLMMGGN